jgi:hypothetical protein
MKGAAETFMVPPSSLVEATNVDIDSFDDLGDLEDSDDDSLDLGSDDMNITNLDELDEE